MSGAERRTGSGCLSRVFSVVKIGVVVVVALMLGGVLASFNPFRDFLDSIFDRTTVVASGDVVLRQLREESRLVAASASFQVPVVVCNKSARSFVVEGADEDETGKKKGQTPAEEILEYCTGLTDAKAVLLVTAEVEAAYSLDQLKPDSVVVNGESVTVELPQPEIGSPKVDAEDGILVISSEDEWYLPGSIPDDVEAIAAAEGKSAVTQVAAQSELAAYAKNSAEKIFRGLLESTGFTTVTVKFETVPKK